jgi:hypothetical protein
MNHVQRRRSSELLGPGIRGGASLSLRLAGCAAACIGFLVASPTARADGGKSDRVTIDWEVTDPSETDVILNVESVGTTDYNFLNEQAIASDSPNSNGKNELQFFATQSGVMPMEFKTSAYSCLQPTPGPYDFTAYVVHKLVARLVLTGNSRRRHRSAFAVSLHTPDGTPVDGSSLTCTVQTSSHGRWRNSTTDPHCAPFAVHWSRAQRGKGQVVRVNVAGPGYAPTSTNAMRVKGV